MTKFPKLELSRLRHLGNILLVTLVAVSTFAAVPVVESPVFKQQLFDNNGKTLAFGCVFSYNSGTTNPLATYVDNTGTSVNTNPVILDAAGRANIWLRAGVAYSITVKSAGGTNCALGTTLYSVNGVGSGTSVQTTIVPSGPTPAFPISAQVQLFQMLLTGNAVAQPLTAVGIIPPGIIYFELTQDGAGGHSFTWPSNLVGGAPIGLAANQVTVQAFIWNGVQAEAVGPGITGPGPALSTGTITVAGDVIATGDVTAAHYKTTCANGAVVGTFRLCKTDTINWRNDANGADQGLSQDTSNRLVASHAGGLELTGAIPSIFFGGVTASFPSLKRTATSLGTRLADDSGDAPFSASTLTASGLFAVAGPEVSTPASPSAGNGKGYFKANSGWCAVDSAGIERCGVAGSSGFGKIQIVKQIGSLCTTGATSFDTCTDTLTWPATFGDTNYAVVCSGANVNNNLGGEAGVLQPDSLTATTVVVKTQNMRSVTAHMDQVSCIGIHF